MAVDGRYRIGEMAERTGRSIHTLRWYESEGLLPGVERDDTNRRLYRAEHIDWLHLLDRLQRTGMSIQDMRRYTELVGQGPSTLSERRRLLAMHREMVMEKITEWESALELIDRKIDFYGAWLATGRRPRLPGGTSGT